MSHEGPLRLDALPSNFPLEVDLLASRLTHELPTCASWRPNPMAMATDAFTVDWSELKRYTNFPRDLIGRVLAHNKQSLF